MSKLPPPKGPNVPMRKAGDPAWLPSEGRADGRCTIHTFVRTEEVPADALKYANGPRSMRPGFAHVFRCTETGVERRWGIE